MTTPNGDRITFLQCVFQCAQCDSFVKEWCRMRGLMMATSPIDRMIDSASGYDSTIAATFFEDVYDLVWTRLPPEVRWEPTP